MIESLQHICTKINKISSKTLYTSVDGVWLICFNHSLSDLAVFDGFVLVSQGERPLSLE